LGVVIQLDVRRQRYTKRGQFREDLIHGADLISLTDERFASVASLKGKRRVYTLSAAVTAIRKYVEMHPGTEVLWNQFFELLTFDALIGGTDRHYYNWGVLQNADTGAFLRLAPAFDNGMSLLWKLEEYAPIFLADPWTHRFALRAESMFKKDDCVGKYRLCDALEALHEQGDYENSNIASELLDRLRDVNPERIRSVIIKNVPKSDEFGTSVENLNIVSSYTMERYTILVDTLARMVRQ